MSNLIPVPYQPEYSGTPDTVALLLKACQLAGHNIPLVDGWRSYAQQAYYYDQYLNHGGPTASNPDTGQRNHMRGAAWDIANPPADRQYMLAAGFTPDAVEDWHFNNPNWANMPIIPVNTTVASIAATPVIEREEDMGFSLVKDAKSATIFCCSLSTGNRVGVQSPYHVQLLQRYRKNNADDPMLVIELDIVHTYLSAINHAG